MSEIKKFFLGHRDLEDQHGIITYLADRNGEREANGHYEALLIFSTAKQRTWFIASEDGLSCVLDDVRKPHPQWQWTLPKEDLVKDGSVTVEIVSRSKSTRSGTIDVGPRRRWLFSKYLFQSADPVPVVSSLIERKIA